MMRRTTTLTNKRLIPFLCAALLVFAAGCASNDVPVEEPVDTSEFEEAPAPPPLPTVRDTTVANRNLSIAPVYFDLDESSIKPYFESILQSAAGPLRDSGASVTIAGHCDARGSDEYNIALGERRANAVRSYLYNLGVPNGQMTVVSFGEARPAVNGATETAYQLNRRVEFSMR